MEDKKEIIPSNQDLEQLVQGLYDAGCKFNDEILYTAAFIAQYIIHELIGIEKAEDGWLGPLIYHSIFKMYDENLGYAYYADKIKLQYLDI